MEKQLETKLTPMPTPTKRITETPMPTPTQRITETPMPTQRIPQGVNLNIKNMQNVQFEIQRKKYSEKPYYATQKNVIQVITDYDELPYRRWYRGVPESDVPIVAEREAGYRPLIRQIYIEKKPETPQCFERGKKYTLKRHDRQVSKQREKEDSARHSSKQDEDDDEEEDDNVDDRQVSNRRRDSQRKGDSKRDDDDDRRDLKRDSIRDRRTRPRDNGGWKNIDNYTSVMLRTV